MLSLNTYYYFLLFLSYDTLLCLSGRGGDPRPLGMRPVLLRRLSIGDRGGAGAQAMGRGGEREAAAPEVPLGFGGSFGGGGRGAAAPEG